MTRPLNVGIVDDNKYFREGLRFFIESKTEWCIVQEEKSGVDLLEKGFNIIPDILLMDINMPDLNGIDTTFKILSRYSRVNTKVIAVTLNSDNNKIEALIKAGFRGCILKKNVYTDLIKAVTIVKDGSVYFNNSKK